MAVAIALCVILYDAYFNKKTIYLLDFATFTGEERHKAGKDRFLELNEKTGVCRADDYYARHTHLSHSSLNAA